MIFEISTRKSNSQLNFNRPPTTEFWGYQCSHTRYSKSDDVIHDSTQDGSHAHLALTYSLNRQICILTPEDSFFSSLLMNIVWIRWVFTRIALKTIVGLKPINRLRTTQETPLNGRMICRWTDTEELLQKWMENNEHLKINMEDQLVTTSIFILPDVLIHFVSRLMKINPA